MGPVWAFLLNLKPEGWTFPTLLGAHEADRVEPLTQAPRPLALCWVWPVGEGGRRPEVGGGYFLLRMLTPCWVASDQGHRQALLSYSLPCPLRAHCSNSSPPLLALPAPLPSTPSFCCLP